MFSAVLMRHLLAGVLRRLKLLIDDSAESLDCSLSSCLRQHLPKAVQSYSLDRSWLGPSKKGPCSLCIILLLEEGSNSFATNGRASKAQEPTLSENWIWVDAGSLCVHGVCHFWARLLRGLTVARISPQCGQRKRK